PAPGWISMKQSLPSASPLSRASSSICRTCLRRASRVLPPSSTTAVSFSASPSSISSSVSLKSVSSFWVVVIIFSARVRSRINFCALCASFQRLGSSAAAFSSSRRLRRLSQSKAPPQHSEGLLELVFDTVDVYCHHLFIPSSLHLSRESMDPSNKCEDDALI